MTKPKYRKTWLAGQMNGKPDLAELKLLAAAEETLRIVRLLSEHVLKCDPTAARFRRRPVRVRFLPMTQFAFERLPGLVRRQEFMDWTGLSEKELRQEVRAGRIPCYRPSEHAQALYYKSEIARLGKWKL